MRRPDLDQVTTLVDLPVLARVSRPMKYCSRDVLQPQESSATCCVRVRSLAFCLSNFGGMKYC